MKNKVQITSFQVVYASGARDTIKLLQPVIVNNIEEYRKELRIKYDAVGVNLTYTELPNE